LWEVLFGLQIKEMNLKKMRREEAGCNVRGNMEDRRKRKLREKETVKNGLRNCHCK
jgi:hypothetical protein